MINLRGGNDDAAHHILELKEIDAAVMVLINGGNHHLNSVELSAFLEAKLAEDDLELLSGDVAVAILVKDLEGLGEIVLLLLVIERGGIIALEAEEGIVEGAVEGLKVLEPQAGVARLDVGLYHGVQLGLVSLQPQKGQGLSQLIHRDHAVVVLVEDVEDAPQPHRVQARAP